MKHLNLLLKITMILGTIYFAIFQYDSSKILTYLAVIPILLAPNILRKTKFQLQEKELFYYLLFVFFANFLGSVANLYNLTTWYDILIHFISGIFNFGIGLFLLERMEIDKKDFIFRMIFSISIVMLIGSIWEFFEFGADLLLDMNLQHQLDTGVVDTMIDLLASFFGGTLSIITCTIKKQKVEVIKMFQIGNLKIKNKIVLAPMAGVCNSAFRKIVKEMGAGLMYAEMVSDKALVYASQKTENMLYMEEYERPIAQQIFGSDKETFVEAAKLVYEKMKPDIIDINMGCPVPKVALRAQAGSALLKNPEKIKEIVEAVVQAVPIPVTVKIRSGWDQQSINAVEVARICEKAGASAITIHGRTRSQGYSGHVDYEIIKKVKEAVTIPVIGNGDITDIDSAKKMFETGVDAIMIGRGCLGNPWLIKQLVAYFEDGTILPKPTIQEKIEMCFHHLEYLSRIKCEKVTVLEMRSHVAWYVKGLPDSIEVKNACFKATTIEELKEILKNYLNKQNT